MTYVKIITKIILWSFYYVFNEIKSLGSIMNYKIISWFRYEMNIEQEQILMFSQWINVIWLNIKKMQIYNFKWCLLNGDCLIFGDFLTPKNCQPDDENENAQNWKWGKLTCKPKQQHSKYEISKSCNE